MQFYAPLNSILLYGGKSDKSSETINSTLYSLRMDNFTWTTVNNIGTHLYPRAGMASCIAGTQLIFFGGVSEKFSQVNSTIVIELNQKKTKKILEAEEKRNRGM